MAPIVYVSPSAILSFNLYCLIPVHLLVVAPVQLILQVLEPLYVIVSLTLAPVQFAVPLLKLLFKIKFLLPIDILAKSF